MIVYHENVNTFINSCAILNSNGECYEIADKITKAMLNAGITNFNESQVIAWRKSLPFVAKALKKANIDKDVKVAIEYKINQQRTRIDFVIYGLDEKNKKNVVIIELKQWSEVSSSKKPEYVYAQVSRSLYEDHWHPSYQAYNYANSIRNFNVYVRQEPINLYSCSYLHNMSNDHGFLLENKDEFPVINTSPCFLEEDVNKLIDFLERYVKHPCNDLLYRMEDSELIPSDLLAHMLRDAIKGNDFFAYDDAQRNAVSTIVAAVRDAKYYNSKQTIIVRGGAGTGKSIVAINALGQLLNPKKGKPLNAAYFTANASPRNLYTEELIGDNHKKRDIEQLFKHPLALRTCKENDFDCCIYDEAHRLYDFKGGTGLSRSDHLFEKTIKACLVSVFFIDENQTVTCDDYVTIERIREMAHKCHSRVIEGPDLELTSQFRCLGGDTYISFIKSLLGYNNDGFKFSKKKNKYEFKVFDSPLEMFNEIKKKDEEEQLHKCNINGKLLNDHSYSGKSRLVAGYTHKWVSKNEGRDGDNYDFVYDDGFKAKWNLRAGVSNNYSWLNDSTSINEIGCIHTCQGLDLSYCGVIIGKDLIYRNGEILIDTETHPTTDKAFNRNTSRDLVRKIIRNTYYVLLTRGIKGTFVYCEDKELNEYIKSMIVE